MLTLCQDVSVHRLKKAQNISQTRVKMMMVKTLKRVQSFTYPEAREASERRVKCAAVAAEQLLNCFVLLWRKLC